MDIYLDIFGHPLISQRDIYASCRYPKRISSCLQISRYISSPMLISKADIFLSSDIHGYLVAFLSPFGYQAGYPGPLSVAIHEYIGYPITISTPFPGYPSILPLWALPAPPPGPLLCACCSQNVYLLTPCPMARTRARLCGTPRISSTRGVAPRQPPPSTRVPRSRALSSANL